MKTMGKALLLGLLISGSCLQAQSKSELKERLALLESQVDQLKKALISVNNENKSLKAKAGATEKQPRAEVKYQNCDRLKDTIDEQREQIRFLQEELYRARLAKAERIMPAQLKRQHFTVHNASVRDRLDKAYYEHYLGNCLRVSNIQRLFSEDIIIEFEKNPYEHRFAGFLRHRYTPEMGKDEYSMQRIEGTYTWDEEFTSLHINNLDNKAVDITIRYEDERELYNEISGSERDLALISTHYGNVQEFSFVRCK